ncbi:MAG: hypothetical protein QXQ57_08010 [Sulfolobales archaeon]
MARVARTVAIRSVRLPRKVFNIFVELEGMYRDMVEQLVMHDVRSDITSFTRLKASNYSVMRSLYPQLPSHYIQRVKMLALGLRALSKERRRALQEEIIQRLEISRYGLTITCGSLRAIPLLR